MGGGEVLESGTHNELLSAGAAYATLVNGQTLAAANEETPEGSVTDVDAKEALSFEAHPPANGLQRTATGKSSLVSQPVDVKTTGLQVESVMPYRKIAMRFWR
jgi:hypothetical protein